MPIINQEFSLAYRSGVLTSIPRLQNAAQYVHCFGLQNGEEGGANKLIKSYDIGEKIAEWLRSKGMAVPCNPSDFNYDLGEIFRGQERFILLVVKFSNDDKLEFAIDKDGWIKGLLTKDNHINVKAGKKVKLIPPQLNLLQDLLKKL